MYVNMQEDYVFYVNSMLIDAHFSFFSVGLANILGHYACKGLDNFDAAITICDESGVYLLDIETETENCAVSGE